MAGTEDSLLTPRLRLVPIGPDNAADLWLLHNDNAVGLWYDCWRPSRHEADDHARRIAESWRLHGVHKWMAYDRETGEVVGRGGLSWTPIDDDWASSTRSCPMSRCATPCQCRTSRRSPDRFPSVRLDRRPRTGARRGLPFLRYETIDEPGGAVGLAQHAVGGFVDGAARGVVFLERCGLLGREVADALAVYRLGRSRPAPAWGVVAGW